MTGLPSAEDLGELLKLVTNLLLLLAWWWRHHRGG